ncbi:MAG: hypothetical protein M3Z37_03585 [Candidatus Eremiobacteraeota bacterium]|nr:hypothetical protein [Candidatus Eremiobacteraeota bacterium]
MRHRVASFGFSLIELLVSIGIIVLLMLVVCAAIVQTLRIELLHSGRIEMGRTASQLSQRLQEDARSSTAVFIPSVDVLGDPNTGSNAHEVDFFRRLSAGGDVFVAYRFEAGSAEVTRFEYSSMVGLKTIGNRDVAGSGISSFEVVRKPVAQSDLIAGQPDLARVAILYGTPERVGGNDIIVASIATQATDGAPTQQLVVHLAARAAPTSLAIFAPPGPPPNQPPTHTVPFVILRPGFQLHLPHGPIHKGDPGNTEDSIHWVAAFGAVQFFGSQGLAGSWFEMTSLYGSVSSGTYSFSGSNGSVITAVISCDGGICPPFQPAPVFAPGFTPRSGVAFQTDHL